MWCVAAPYLLHANTLQFCMITLVEIKLNILNILIELSTLMSTQLQALKLVVTSNLFETNELFKLFLYLKTTQRPIG